MIKALPWLRWLKIRSSFPIAKTKTKPKQKKLTAKPKQLAVSKYVNVLEHLGTSWFQPCYLDIEPCDLEPKDLIAARIAWRVQSQSVIKALHKMRKFVQEETANQFLLQKCLDTLKDKGTIQQAYRYFRAYPVAEKIVSSVAEVDAFDCGQNIQVVYDGKLSDNVAARIKLFCRGRGIKARRSFRRYPALPCSSSMRWLKSLRTAKPKPRQLAISKDVNVMEYIGESWFQTFYLYSNVELDIDNNSMFEPKDLIAARIAWRSLSRRVCNAVIEMRRILQEETVTQHSLQNCLNTLKDKDTIQEAYNYGKVYPLAVKKTMASVAEVEAFDYGQPFWVLYYNNLKADVVADIVSFCTRRGIDVQRSPRQYPIPLL